MNRTQLILSAAVVLALVAVVAGGVRPRGQGPAEPSPTTPTVSDGSLSMTSRLSHPFIAPGQQDVFVTVDVRGAEVPGAKRVPVNLAIVIDRSGSMAGFKLDQARQAARQLVAQLGATDRLTIVHYGSDVKSLEGLLATPENKERMRAYIDGIEDDGGTNIGEALTTASELLARAASDYKVNRLILVSDGQPTEGVTDFAALANVARSVRQRGISVSSIGVGDDFNEGLMQELAEVGAGAYGYLQDAAQLAGIFQKDLTAAGTQVARGVTLSFRVPPGARLQQVLGYKQVTTVGDVVTVSLPDFAGGQVERVVAQLTVAGTHDGQAVDVSGLTLDYTDVLTSAHVASQARLAAMTSGDTDVVAKGRDKDALVFATRAQAAKNAEQAADLLSQGDRHGAERLIQQNEALFDEAGAVAGAPAVAADLASQRSLLEDARKAKSDDDLRVYKKAVNSKARKDYGLMGSTY